MVSKGIKTCLLGWLVAAIFTGVCYIVGHIVTLIVGIQRLADFFLSPVSDVTGFGPQLTTGFMTVLVLIGLSAISYLIGDIAMDAFKPKGETDGS